MKKHWSLTRLEKIGIVSLSTVIVALTIVLNVNSAVYNPATFQVDTTSLEYVSLIEKKESVQDISTDNVSDFKTYSLTEFDPNLINEKEWKGLGFSEKQAKSILKYRDNFGPFKVKEDLKKVFVISDKKYRELEPFIIIDNSSQIKTSLEININEADEQDLQKIKGIGEVYAQRIIKYRNLIGGFHSQSQLKEVYGLSEEALLVLLDNVVFDDNVRQIDINNVDKQTLKKHPYFDFEMTASILKERELNKLINLNFLVEQGIINEEKMNKIIPYILF